jgi:hypothetical protein
VDIPSIDIPDEDPTSGSGGAEGGAESNRETPGNPPGEAEAEEASDEENEYGELPKALLADLSLSLDARLVYSNAALAPAIFEL